MSSASCCTAPDGWTARARRSSARAPSHHKRARTAPTSRQCFARAAALARREWSSRAPASWVSLLPPLTRARARARTLSPTPTLTPTLTPTPTRPAPRAVDALCDGRGRAGRAAAHVADGAADAARRAERAHRVADGALRCARDSRGGMSRPAAQRLRPLPSSLDTPRPASANWLAGHTSLAFPRRRGDRRGVYEPIRRTTWLKKHRNGLKMAAASGAMVARYLMCGNDSDDSH